MKLVLLILLTVTLSNSFAQSDGNSVQKSQSDITALVFSQEEFQGRLSVLFYSDSNYDFYVIDLTSFKDRFEKVYFMNLTYSDPRIFNIDGDLDKDQTMFKSYYTNKETDITCLFKDMKAKTDEAGLKMNAEEKSAWLAANDKFKKVK
jgi:hypothetical protein